ncbi:MAG: hypothetical protein KDA57_05185 [Planctomycetales bacterium]|nr:hypothetical protein [Planctomycetales bacterium]
MSDPAASDCASSALPRLRIHHLLVLTAVTGFYLTMAKGSLDEQHFHAVYSADASLILITEALAITVVAFGVVWRYQKRKFPGEPGHGLLFQSCLDSALGVSGLLFYACFIDRNEMGQLINFDELPQIAWVYLEWNWFLYAGASILISLTCALWLAENRRWRTYFHLSAAITAIGVVEGLTLMRMNRNSIYIPDGWIEWFIECSIYLPDLVTAAALPVVLFFDYRARVQRHWTHWAGVVCALATVLLTIGDLLFASSGDWASYPTG